MIIFELSTLYIHEKENTSLNLIKKYEILTRDCLENHFVHRGASVFYKEGFSIPWLCFRYCRGVVPVYLRNSLRKFPILL